MNPETPFFSFIIPARNQCRELTLFLFELYRHFDSRKETFEVIVIDDGSRDQTTYVLERLVRQFGTISVVANHETQGLGAAARIGLEKARGTFSILIRPGMSLDIVDDLLRSVSLSFRGVSLGEVQIRSTLWPPALFLFFVWKSTNWIFNWIVPGGVSSRLGPLLFSREVGEELARLGRVRHAGYQFELVFLAHKKGKEIIRRPVSEPMYVSSFPFFYFLTVLKEMIYLSIRSLRGVN